MSLTVLEPTGRIRRSEIRDQKAEDRISKLSHCDLNDLTKSPCALNLAPYASVIDQ